MIDGFLALHQSQYVVRLWVVGPYCFELHFGEFLIKMTEYKLVVVGGK